MQAVGDRKTAANISDTVSGEDLQTASTSRPHASRRAEPLTPYPRILVTPVGLQIPDNISYEDWENAGGKLAQIANTSAWCLGDWIVHGQERFRDRYRCAAQEAGLDYQTLRNYAWVARKVQQARRRHQLSFQHHAEVASLDAAEQNRWLRQAEANKWSRNTLRIKIRAAADHGVQRPTSTSTLSQLPITPESLERWRAAAELSRTSFGCWLVETLNGAADEALGGEGAIDVLPTADSSSAALSAQGARTALGGRRL